MNRFAILVCLVILSGCASNRQPGFKPVPDSVPPVAKSVEILINVEQKELNADIERMLVAPGPFALFIAGAALVVNNERSKSAEIAVAPVRDALVGFSPNETLRNELAKSLKAISWIGNGPVEVNVELKNMDEEREKRYAESKYDAVLMLDFNYTLSSNFKTLLVETEVNLYPKSEGLRDIQSKLYGASSKILKPTGDKIDEINALYTHNISIKFELPTLADNLDARGKAWAANEGQFVRTAFQGAANVISRVVADDLAKPAALNAENVWTLIKRGPYTLELDGKRYKVTQSNRGHSAVVVE